MDQIRKTMMQHETLFKEQVQALHKLYSIQKMEMQECKRRNHYGGQSKVLAFNRQSVVLVEDQFPASVLEGRPLMPVFGSGRGRKEETFAANSQYQGTEVCNNNGTFDAPSPRHRTLIGVFS